MSNKRKVVNSPQARAATTEGVVGQLRAGREVTDGTVHAEGVDGTQVVRYDKAGKWWIEYQPHMLRSARPVSISEAVAVALDCERDGGVIHLCRSGGRAFDRMVRKAKAK